MWTAFIAALVNAISGVANATNSIFTYFKEQQLIKLGKESQQAEELKDQIDQINKQDQILLDERSKVDVEDKLKKGNFRKVFKDREDN